MTATLDIASLLCSIARVGAESPLLPDLRAIEPFAHFFNRTGQIESNSLDKRDGSCTRRELILRFLVLNAVLDQGLDIVGVRRLLLQVTNNLYRREVRFLHSPAAFFAELGIAIDQIVGEHSSIKKIRSETWARENQSSPNKYNLFMDNAKQALSYTVFRWGVPLALPLLLERDERDEDRRDAVLVRYLKSWQSAEEMSQQLKDNERYGLGKAIGDKAGHLFAKWAVSSFALLREATPNWNAFSFEVPFDSNTGRVLWRTGFFLHWADESDYVRMKVVQRGAGKGGTNYIRVTNIRGMKAAVDLPDEIWKAYVEICCKHLRSHKKAPQTAEIQRIPLAYLLSAGTSVASAELDEGLIHIGTRFCFNHSEPKCRDCPIRKHCVARISKPELIRDYRT